MKRREYTYEDYKRVMDMYKRGIGPTEISRKTGIKKRIVRAWIYERKIPWLAKWIPEPSKELAYIIGVLHGDGNLHLHGYNGNRFIYDIELEVKDLAFAETFSRNMSKLLNKKFKKPRWSESHKLWRINYSSKAFYTWYKKQSLESLKLYIEYNKDTVTNFLRGLYDSEGCNYKCKQIYLYNNNKDLLRYVQYLLRKYFNITATGPYLHIKVGDINIKRDGEKIKANHNNYRIDISRKDSIQRFLSEVGFSIREKQLGSPRRKPP